MPAVPPLFSPPSLGIAVVGTALSGLAVVGIGVASLAQGHAMFSVGVGVMLVLYGLVVLLGAWLGYRRVPVARGMMVAPALLHVATAVSLLQAGDAWQTTWAVLALLVCGATAAVAVLPSTYRALSPADPHPAPEGP